MIDYIPRWRGRSEVGLKERVKSDQWYNVRRASKNLHAVAYPGTSIGTERETLREDSSGIDTRPVDVSF